MNKLMVFLTFLFVSVSGMAQEKPRLLTVNLTFENISQQIPGVFYDNFLETECFIEHKIPRDSIYGYYDEVELSKLILSLTKDKVCIPSILLLKSEEDIFTDNKCKNKINNYVVNSINKINPKILAKCDKINLFPNYIALGSIVFVGPEDDLLEIQTKCKFYKNFKYKQIQYFEAIYENTYSSNKKTTPPRCVKGEIQKFEIIDLDEEFDFNTFVKFNKKLE